MTPRGFGARLALVVWTVLTAAIVAVGGALGTAAGALFGLYVASLCIVLTAGLAVLVGLGGWAWAWQRRAVGRPAPTSPRLTASVTSAARSLRRDGGSGVAHPAEHRSATAQLALAYVLVAAACALYALVR